MTDLHRQLRDSLSVARVAAIVHEQAAMSVDYDRCRRAATWALQSLDAGVAGAALLRAAQALIIIEDLGCGQEARSFGSLTDSAKAHYLRAARSVLNAYHASLEGFGPLSSAETGMLARLDAGRAQAHRGIIDQLKDTLAEVLR